MKRMLMCAVCVLALNATPSLAGRSRVHAQSQQVIVPAAVAQSVISQQPAVAQAPRPQLIPSPGASTTGVSCCPDHGTTGQCTPACQKGKNEPTVTSKCPPGTEKCKDIPVEVTPGIDTVVIDEKFYVKCDDAEAKVPVPLLEIKTTERCEFKKYTYKVDCCEVTVCVPCRSCVTEAKKCVTKISDKPQKIRLCYRRDGTVDVYVLDVPGMPKQWLLYMEAKVEDVKKDLGI